MKVETKHVPGVLTLTPQRHRDDRGFLSEVYNASSYEELGIEDRFVQENHIFSDRAGTIRGLHYQSPPSPTAKLIRVTRGSILDVVVDLRQGSPTYGEHVSEVLTAANWKQMYHPIGCAHGFCTLDPETEVVYLSSAIWKSELDRGVLWSDPELGIDWPVTESDAMVSDKDRAQPRLADIESPFSYPPG